MEVKLQSISYLLEEKPSILVRSSSTVRRREHVKSVLLLDKVSLTLHPGSVNVVLGTGKGCIYLMDIIALRQQEGLLAGKILCDCQVRKTGFYKDITIVNDIGIAHFGSLTIFDYLYYGSRLRVTHGVVECRERARLACRVTGLDGSLQLHQLSKTELRILSIAIEIVGNPTLIVLKDPIEGLDAAGALEVMKVLRTVAKRISMPTTIVYNIPSLSEDMLPLVDHYNIFLGHTLAYTCSLTDFPHPVRPEAAAVWSNISHLLREAKDKEPRDVFEPIIDATVEGENESIQAFDRLFDAFDTLITTTTNTNSSNSNTTSTIRGERAKSSINNEEEKKELIIEHGKFKPGFYPQLSTTGVAGGQSVSEFYAVTRKLETGDSGNGGLPVRIPLPIYKEVWVLFTRSIQNHYRNSASLLWGLVRMVLAAVLLGCLVLREGDNLDATNLVTSPSTGLIDRHAYNVSGVLFAIIVLVVLATAFAVPYVHSTGQLIKAEVAAGLVSTPSAWVALGTVDLMMYTAACWALAVLVYVLINIQGSLGHYCWLLLLVTYCGYSLAATCAVWFRSLRQAWTCFAFITATCLIFAGFLQRLGSLGGLWAFLASLSFTRWAYEGLSIVAFSDAPDRDNYLQLFGFDNTSTLYCSVWLVVWILLLQVLVLVGLMPPMYHMRVASNMRQFATTAPESTLSSTAAAEDHSSDTGRQQSTSTDWQFSARMKERLDSLWETTKSLAHIHTPTKQQHSRRRTSKQKKGTPVSISAPLPRPPSLPSAAAREKTGYEPPPLPGGVEANCCTEAAAVAEEDEEETTVQFSTMHSMFGAYMQIHRHEEEDHPVVDIGSSCSSPVKSPVKTAPEVKSLSPVQTESFSSRIRNKAALGPDRVELVPIKGAPESSLQTPGHAPLSQSGGKLSAVLEEGSGSSNPILRDREVNSSNVNNNNNNNNNSSSSYRAARRGQRQQRNISADALESQHPPPGINYSVGMGNIVRIPPQMATTLSFSRLKHVQDSSLLSRAPTSASLHGVSYQLAPGSCCCVVDGTGDGAAALLLQVLAGKTVTTGKTSGAIYVNKQRLDKDLQYLNAAYVQRGDVGQDLQHLTVRQILRYAAYLRRTDHLAVSSLELLRSYLRQDSASGAAPELMYEGASVDSLIGKSFDLEHRLNEVLALLCLEDVADTPIGTGTLLEDDSFSISAALKLPPAPRSLLNLAQSHRSGAVGFRSLSGSGYAVTGSSKLTAAERRCVAIGVELVNRPGLVFLDDPFVGLQWQDAEKVAAILRNLARGGRTVVCCTDKPCQRVLACMSELLLLSAGLLVYSGPADAAAKHFANIGFEKPTGQNELDFVLDIAADRGKMKLIGGKRSNTLSPEDLADLNRSLVNIKAGRQKEEDAFEDAEHAQDQLLIPGSKPQMGNQGTALPQRTALQRSVEPQTWDIAVILAARGLHSIFLNKTLVFRHCLQCLMAGLLLGSVWWDIDGGNYQSRISLFATSYLAINLIVVDTIEGIFQRKETFQRETVVGVSTYKAHFLADCVGAYLLSLLGALLYTLPLYTMAGLRAGFGHYLYFLVATVLGVYSNISLSYLLTRLCEARLTCKLLYAGAVLPLQLLLSGYPILLRTMPLWLSWGASLCPMYYYMCGTFRNELLHNSHALGTGVSYHQLQLQYAYSYDLTTCIVLLLVLGFCCKGCWLATLRVSDLYHRQPMQQRMYGIRRKTRKLLQASLRWRDTDNCTYYANTTGTATDNINYNNSSSRVMEEEEFSEVDFGNDFHFRS